MTPFQRLKGFIRTDNHVDDRNSLTRMAVILELAEFAERAYRMKLRERFPDISLNEEEEMVQQWYFDKPLPSDSDPDFVPRKWNP